MLRESNGLLKQAEEAKWVCRLDNTPLIVLRAPMTKLVTAIRKIVVEDVALKHHFEEWIFPRMVPEEVLAKTGWLNNHREEAWLVDPKREFVFKPDEPGLFPRKNRFPHEPLPYALDPIQCVSLYYAFFDKTLEENQIPLKVFEYQGGWTHRYERLTGGLERGIEFLRLELVWIAMESEAIQLRNATLQSAVNMLIEQLELEITVAEGDSCFEEPTSDSYAEDSILPPDRLSELFPVASVDILTAYQDRRDLEVASASRHDLLPRRFEIKVKQRGGDAMHPWSGCLGIGLTRLAAAFLHKHGFDQTHWPTRVKRYFDEAGA